LIRKQTKLTKANAHVFNLLRRGYKTGSRRKRKDMTKFFEAGGEEKKEEGKKTGSLVARR